MSPELNANRLFFVILARKIHSLARLGFFLAREVLAVAVALIHRNSNRLSYPLGRTTMMLVVTFTCRWNLKRCRTCLQER